MKRIITFLLCLAMLITVPVAVNAAETVFNANTDTTTPLFLISGSNKAGQEFVPGFDSLQGVKVYLNNEVADNTITVTVYSGSAAVEGAQELYSEDLTLAATGAQWFTLTFSQAVSVESDALHSFTLHTENRSVWNGTATGDGSYKALNYDEAAYGGWVRGNITAFELFAKYEGDEPYAAVAALIDALPKTIALTDEETVVAARAAYNNLTSEQKAKVTNVDVLTAAEEAIKTLKQQLENKQLNELVAALAAIGTVTRDSAEAILDAQEKANAYAYEKGVEELAKVEGYDGLSAIIAAYNDLIQYENGDVNANKAVDSIDALAVLRNAVGKQDLTQKEFYSADVNLDKIINAADALLILKFAVKKIDSFPSDDLTLLPVEEEIPMYSKKNVALFNTTYQSMIDRTEENGYAQTSITGAYPGMFGRDSSIQIMAHVAAGDYDHAAKIMQYILDYHKKYDYDYLLHVMNNNASPISTKLQVDSTFFFIHAWYLYATQAPESAEKTAFLAASEEQIKAFADRFMDSFYFHENGLILNQSLEHSREVRYWYCYDLLTNTYASQGWHELSLYFAEKDPEKAKAWGAAADRIVAGVHEHLTSEIDGKTFYAELIDVENNNNFVQGFSWVNLAPMGCDWYGADPEILENTYQLYLKYGSCTYYRKYQMLDVVSTYNGRPLSRGDHVIGKGLAWEMLYCKKMGYTDRLATLVSFIENYSDEMYRETWGYNGGGSDTANQEHASWMLYAHKTCFPELSATTEEKVTGVRVGTYNIHILSDVNRDASVIAKDITDSGLDIAGLQEVDVNTVRSGKADQAKQVAEALGWYYAFAKAIDHEGGEYGHCIVSKYPIESFTVTQLESGGEEQRVFGHAVILVGNQKINVLNTHFTWTGVQSWQFSQLADYVKKLDNFIITGDFNCTNFAAYDVLGGQIVNNATDTFITNETDGAIDNIVVCKDFTVSKGVMVDNGHSDHNLLYADIEF